MMNILEIRNLSLQLGGKPILNELSMDIWEGHVHAVVGVNGAGKSTLASTIVGLSGYRDFEGDILFRGTSLKGKSIDERAAMGITLAWQEPARFEGLKVKDFVLAPVKDKNIEIAKQALATVGLKPELYLDRAVDKTLSGGERKKIELASILVMKPALAFLDEPDSGIDIESIERIFEVVKRLKEGGATVVFITHSQAVLKQAEHAFLLCHGRLVDQGTMRKINKYFEHECMPCDLQDPEKKEFEQ
jgi:Fe-S cluster assembly ATP-binding protein